MVLTGSEATRQTIETFLPLGTVKYIEVGDNCGAHANSAKLKLWTWMPKSLRGPWQDGSTILGTLLWVSHKRKLRCRQSQVHLQHQEGDEISDDDTTPSSSATPYTPPSCPPDMLIEVTDDVEISITSMINNTTIFLTGHADWGGPCKHRIFPVPQLFSLDGKVFLPTTHFQPT